MRTRFLTVALSVGLVSSASLSSGSAQEASGWKMLEKKSGIAVSAKEISGRSIPMYRGQAQVGGPILEVLAVILDDARSKEWAKDVSEAEVLRVIDDNTTVVYSRSHQTWPVRDRDLVMKRTVVVSSPGEAYQVKLVCLSKEKPEVSRVVRIKDCESTFTLKKIDDKTTAVDFQMRVEPGGNHPDWAVRMASKNVPYETLVGLKNQVQRTRGQHAAVVRRYRAQ